MTFNKKTLLRFLPFIFAISIVNAEQMPEANLVRTGGIYRSEVQTTTDGTAYTSELLFTPDGRVILQHHVSETTQERLCELFKPQYDNWQWAKATSYRLDVNRLNFRTTSLNATTVFDGTIESGVLRLQLVVPTKQNLTYPLTFQYAPCHLIASQTTNTTATP
jgi:hypothetical protein